MIRGDGTVSVGVGTGLGNGFCQGESSEEKELEMPQM